MAQQIELVGADQDKTDEFNAYLDEEDPCFGKHYKAKASECAECQAIVVHRGVLCTLSTVCRAVCAGQDSVSGLHRLTSADILERIQAGATIQELFAEVLADANPDELAYHARTLLSRRLDYLSRKGIPVPEVPTTQALKEKL